MQFEENLSKISVNIDERFKEASNMLETYDLENKLREMFTNFTLNLDKKVFVLKIINSLRHSYKSFKLT